MKYKNSITIIAGPCSVDENNLAEIQQLAEMKAVNSNSEIAKAIYGTRVVGLKSRTGLDPSGSGMGMDFEAIMHNLQNPDDQVQLPSIEIAAKIQQETGMLVATELLLPQIQLPVFKRAGIPAGKLLAWNPATNQLGWPILQTALIAKENGWLVGLKNGKWLGEELEKSESVDFQGETSFDKQWKGNVDYASVADEIIMIQRGVDVPGKGDFRNAVVHQATKRVKAAVKAKYPNKNIKMFFDPSHSYGPKLRDQIPGAIIEAMKLELTPEEALYDGILVEVGTSLTDTEQHISLLELQETINNLSEFRTINARQ